MRIALVHTRLMRRGGLERRLFTYMEEFRKAGHQVTIIVHRRDRNIQLPPDVRLIYWNLNLIPKHFRIIVFDHLLGKLVKKEKFDFVFSLARTSHQDAVLVPGNHLGFLKSKGREPQSISDKVQVMMDRRAYHSPGKLLACSKMMKEEVMELYHVPAEKIEILYPPIDHTKFHSGLRQNRWQLRRKYQFDDQKKTFLFVSSSHYRKGLPLLLEVFSELRDAPMELVIAGVGKVSTSLPNVKNLGFIRETQELYAAADFLVLPAIYEPFGQVVGEAIMSGTPVIISHMVGAKEIVSNKEGIILPHFQPRQWREALLEACERQFDISPDFAAEHQLRLQDHINHILTYAREIQHHKRGMELPH